jgi:hypothetical protein
MPIPNNVVIGTTIECDCYFFDSDGKSPLATVGGVAFAIYAPNNLKVLGGIATQDFTNPAHWTATIAIPSNAPITNSGQYYTLQWIANTNTTKQIQTQQFNVGQPGQPDQTDASVVAIQNMPFDIDLVLPFSSIQTLSLRIIDSSETVIVTMTGLPVLPVSQNGQQFIYRIPITSTQVLGALAVTNNTGYATQDNSAPNILVAAPRGVGYGYGNPGFGLLPYMAYVNYTDPQGGQNYELQPIYICSTLMIQLMKNVQNFIDILRNNDTIPQLRVTEGKLVHFLINGLLRFNAEPPQQINYNFATLPPMFQFYVQKAACYEFLQALYLGEGMTAFNFSGMGVQLDSDRTQYIVSLMDSVRADLDKIQLVKKNFAKSGGGTGQIGSIGTTLGPNFNFVFSVAPVTGGNFYGLPFLP